MATKRRGATSRRAIFETDRIRELRRDFQSTVLSLEGRLAEAIASYRDRVSELENDLSDARRMIKLQRRELEYPWYALGRHIVSKAAALLPWKRR